LRTEPALEIRVGVFERGRVVDTETHAADIGLVLDLRGSRLHGDREPQALGRRDRVLERVGADALDDRNAIVGEQLETPDLVERLTTRQPLGPSMPNVV
jgi:hypothetical protein